MGGLAQRPVLNHSMICRFVYFPLLTGGCQLKTVISSPPAPKNLAIAVEFYQQVYAGARHKIATSSTGEGGQCIEQGRTYHILMHRARICINSGAIDSITEI